VAAARAAGEAMGRHVIEAADGIGFIVNRCNRPFSLEALRIVQERVATPQEVDETCCRGGFRMGPFALMDLVGIDVGLAVAKSFYEQSFGEPRWRPSPLAARLVAAGRLGRKSGRGWYEYPPGPPRHEPGDAPDDVSGEPVLERIVVQLVNEACFALGEGVGSAADIDAGMVLGLNHPRGPLEWGDAIGPDRVLATLRDLRAAYGEERYRPAPALSRAVSAGASLRGRTAAG
jgi:3-hydroxybutyryl-CoA dehydrogenase